jgi:hypothetical protein
MLAFGLGTKMLKTPAVKTVQATLTADPDKAFLVLDNRSYPVERRPGIGLVL